MASLLQWTWVWVNSWSWWWTGRPGVLQSMGSRRVRHDWPTEQNWKHHTRWMKPDAKDHILCDSIYMKKNRQIHVWVSSYSVMSLCDPMDCNPPGSSVHGIFQARILKWVAISSSRGSSLPRIESTSLVSSALAGRFFATEPPGKPRQIHRQ